MTAAAPRGFTFDRNDGRAVLPGNLHTNRQLAQWLDFSQPGRVRVFTGKVELGQGILTALMGGQVDFNIPLRTLALPHVQSGRLRYLAMYGAKRWAQAPDVPTLSELGVPIDFVPWTGLFAPAGTPADVLATLRRALRAASQDNQFVETVGKSSAGEIAYLDGSELETFWKADLARTSVTIQRIGRIQ